MCSRLLSRRTFLTTTTPLSTALWSHNTSTDVQHSNRPKSSQRPTSRGYHVDPLPLPLPHPQILTQQTNITHLPQTHPQTCSISHVLFRPLWSFHRSLFISLILSNTPTLCCLSPDNVLHLHSLWILGTWWSRHVQHPRELCWPVYHHPFWTPVVGLLWISGNPHDVHERLRDENPWIQRKLVPRRRITCWFTWKHSVTPHTPRVHYVLSEWQHS
jgi:hypothetical protein